MSNTASRWGNNGDNNKDTFDVIIVRGGGGRHHSTYYSGRGRPVGCSHQLQRQHLQRRFYCRTSVCCARDNRKKNNRSATIKKNKNPSGRSFIKPAALKDWMKTYGGLPFTPFRCTHDEFVEQQEEAAWLRKHGHEIEEYFEKEEKKHAAELLAQKEKNKAAEAKKLKNVRQQKKKSRRMQKLKQRQQEKQESKTDEKEE